MSSAAIGIGALRVKIYRYIQIRFTDKITDKIYIYIFTDTDTDLHSGVATLPFSFCFLFQTRSTLKEFAPQEAN